MGFMKATPTHRHIIMQVAGDSSTSLVLQQVTITQGGTDENAFAVTDSKGATMYCTSFADAIKTLSAKLLEMQVELNPTVPEEVKV